MSIIKPSHIAHSIYEIDGEALQRAGIKGIIIDWTNTIAAKKDGTLSESINRWLHELQSQYGIKVIVVSNGKPPKEEDGHSHEIPALFEAGKPKKKAFVAAMNILGTRIHETAVIGNGIITDVWGGNRVGMYTIFVSSSMVKPRFIGTLKRLFVKVVRV